MAPPELCCAYVGTLQDQDLGLGGWYPRVGRGNFQGSSSLGCEFSGSRNLGPREPLFIACRITLAACQTPLCKDRANDGAKGSGPSVDLAAGRQARLHGSVEKHLQPRQVWRMPPTAGMGGSQTVLCGWEMNCSKHGYRYPKTSPGAPAFPIRPS